MSVRLNVASVIVAVGPLAGFAAPADAVGIRFGVVIGYGYTLLDYDEEMTSWTTDGRFELSGGGFAEFIFKDEMFRITPGVRGFRVGNHVDVNTGPDPMSQFIGEFETTLDYVSFPVLFKFKPARNSGLYLFAGPELGVLVSTRLRTVIREVRNQTNIVVVQNTDEDIKDTMQSYNFSGLVGLGQQRALRGHVLSARLQYNYGLVDVAKTEAWFSTWQTRAFEFILGVGW